MNKQLQQEPALCFHRWTRTPWGAFTGLSSVVKIGVLSVAMSIILLATHVGEAQAEGSDTTSLYRTMHLDSVQVTARQSSAALAWQSVSQTRPLVDQKGAAPLATAESVLRLLPSVDVRERGGRSTQADIAIRGGSFDQTMIMLAGVDFSDARTGHQSHALPVDLDVISDIAIVDVTSQPGALAGAVNFQTYPPYERYARARLEGGRWGYAYGNLSGGWTHRGARLDDRVQAFGAASYRRSDGYRPNTDFWNVNAYSRVIYEGARLGRIDVQGGFQRREWGSNGFYSLKFPLQFESTLTGLASASWSRRWGRFVVNATGSFRQNNDRYEMVRGSGAANHHTTWNAAGEVSSSYDWPRAGSTSLGVNYIRHILLSTGKGMGDPLDNPRHRVPGRRDLLYPNGKQRGTVNMWAGHRKTWRRGWMHAQGAVQNNPYGTGFTFGALGGWHIDRTFSLTGGMTRSMRLPTFTELYYRGGGDYHPNPNLRPEKAMTWRLGVEATPHGRATGWHAAASAWYRLTRNVIDWEQRPSDDPALNGHWWSTQLNRVGTVGAELSVRYTTRGWLRLAMLNYGWMHSDKVVATEYISKYALDYMRHKVSAVVGVAFTHGFTLTMVGSFYDRMGSWLPADGKGASGYKPYFLLDGRVAWERGRVQLYADVTNITATRYFDFGGLTMPGVWATGGIVITLK